jgi:hypothetical protein
MQFIKDTNPSNGLLNSTTTKNLSLVDLNINTENLYHENIICIKINNNKTKEIRLI